MKVGDTVYLYPHGSPQEAVKATVALLSANQLDILLLMEDRPWFATDPILLTGCGVPFFGSRLHLNGAAWGPWVENFSGGHYEIEEKGPNDLPKV